jgi:hypothetical protein
LVEGVCGECGKGWRTEWDTARENLVEGVCGECGKGWRTEWDTARENSLYGSIRSRAVLIKHRATESYEDLNC